MATTPVSKDETRGSFETPAFASNRFFVHVGPTVRIAFAEQAADDLGPFFRTAVAMPHQDAIALKNILTELLRPFEEQIAKAENGNVTSD